MWAMWPELLDQSPVAGNHNRAPSGRRTAAATTKRVDKKESRQDDLRRFIDDVCKALEKNGHEIRESDGRKPLPAPADALRRVFLMRHPEHNIAQSTFNDDLGEIAILLPGPKRYGFKELAEMLSGKFSG